MITLRRAEQKDREFLFAWANDPVTVAGSFLRSTTVTWDQHVRWFSEKLNDPRCFLFIAEDEQGDPVGQVRFDQLGDAPTEAFISVGIEPQSRGHGYGTQIIELGTAEMFARTEVALVHACIRPTNLASQRAFARAGYEACGTRFYEGIDAVYYVARKTECAAS